MRNKRIKCKRKKQTHTSYIKLFLFIFIRKQNISATYTKISFCIKKNAQKSILMLAFVLRSIFYLLKLASDAPLIHNRNTCLLLMVCTRCFYSFLPFSILFYAPERIVFCKKLPSPPSCPFALVLGQAHAHGF